MGGGRMDLLLGWPYTTEDPPLPTPFRTPGAVHPHVDWHVGSEPPPAPAAALVAAPVCPSCARPYPHTAAVVRRWG